MVIATLIGCGVTAALLTSRAVSNEVPHQSASVREDSIDFIADVRPILSSKCFACHGPDAAARKAGLSLVDFDAATRELDAGIAAIVPGELETSEMWLRINDPSDPSMEWLAKLDTSLKWEARCFGFVVVGVPLYFIYEPAGLATGGICVLAIMVMVSLYYLHPNMCN